MTELLQILTHNVTHKYPVTFNGKMFIVHRESAGKPNLKFHLRYPSVETLNPFANIPGVATVTIPGVTTAHEPEPTAAPIVTPAEPEGASARTVRNYVKSPTANAPDPPGAHSDDDEFLSGDATTITGVHNATSVPGVAPYRLTGVDGDAEHAPESVAISNLTNMFAQPDEPVAPPSSAPTAEPKGAFAPATEPEAPAPIVRPVEPKGAVTASTKDGSERAATEDGSEAANLVGHEAAPKDGSDRYVESATTVRRDVKPRSTEIPSQTATAPQLESHRVPNPDARVFVIEDGLEAAPEVGPGAANNKGTRNTKDNGNKAADDDWIEVRSKKHRIVNMPGVTFDPEHFPDGDAVPPSVETLNPLAETQFADADIYESPPNPVAASTAADQHAHVSEMDDAAFPGADEFAEIPGVAEDVFHAPEPVEPVLDATAAPPVFDTEAVAQALLAQQAVTNEARSSPTRGCKQQ